MAVERKVAQPHITQVMQAVGDFFKQQLLGLGGGGCGIGNGGEVRAQRWRSGRRGRRKNSSNFLCFFCVFCVVFAFSAFGIAFGIQRGIALCQPFKKCMQALQRQLHHVVQAQPWQAFKLGAAPLRAVRHVALRGGQNSVGIGLATYTPQQAFGLQARALAGRAFGVAAVFGEHDPNVHFVGFAFQIAKKPRYAIPLFAPVAFFEIGCAIYHPALLRFGEFAPRRIARYACNFGVVQQVVLAFYPRGGLYWLNSALAQGELFIGYDQPPVHTYDAPKTFAGRASARGRVKREHAWQRSAVADAALRAMQPAGVCPLLLGRGVGLVCGAVCAPVCSAAIGVARWLVSRLHKYRNLPLPVAQSQL